MVQNLIRIDDRLIHGQVVVGWGSHLDPEYIILIDDEIASDEMDSELYLMGVPPEYEGRILTIEEGAEFINGLSANVKFIVVIKSPEIACKLYETGLHFDTLNIGGMHSNEGKKEFNRYIYINRSDIDYLKKIKEHGISVTIQDLPGEKMYNIDSLLKSWDNQ